ncbi:MAG: aminotransferase class V-fold PLP-dependent enzyme, partial [Lachnospiraceae bacterium]|nr:aminotransferase class V-fold PLP-dependent enzyme [Lachnospiraceae bacterium]
MQIYLDHSATTRPFDDVRELMRRIEDENYGNPSSMHMTGVRAEAEVRRAREILSGLLKVKEKEICFTSGG